MSVNGPSGLGTLLVQRLDAVLGTTLSQQTNLVNGARPDAITQTPEAQRNETAQNRVTRETREAVEHVQRHGERASKQAVERAKIDAHKSLLEGQPNQPNTKATTSAPTTLGTAARAILALLQGFPEQAAVIRGRQPLLPQQGQTTSGPANQSAVARNTASGESPAPARGTSALPNTQSPARALAQNLSQTIQSSGLFYESHLTALSFGKVAASALRGEPQALLTNASTAPGGQSPGASASSPPQPAATHAGSNPATAPLFQGQSGSHASPLANQSNIPSTAHTASTAVTTANSTQGATASNTALAALHPETHAIVRQQLEVLANQGFVWKGEAWSGTDLEMQIQRREQDTAEQAENATYWSTRLKLALPSLGEVDVRLSLAGATIQMAIIAPRSAGLLQTQTAALRERLDLAGLKITQLTVNPQPTTENDNNEQAAPDSRR